MATQDTVMNEVAAGSEQVSFYDVALSRVRSLYRNYTIRVVLQALLTILGVLTFTFFLIRLMPGNPIDVMVAQILNQEAISYEDAYARVAASFNFDPNATVLDQYLSYLGDLLRFDLGTSITSPGTKVVDQLLRFLPWTLFSVGTGLLMSFTLGILLGILMAYYRNSPLDHALSLMASILSAVPNFIWALIIIIVFGINLRWFNIGALRGTYDPSITPGFTLEFIGNVLEHAALPIFIYIISTLGTWMLSMKSSTVSVLGEDYVTVAEARGLPARRISTAYVGRNAALPLFTQLMIAIGFVLGGAVVIEELLVYWGIGHFLFASITMRDYTSMQGVFLFITASVVFANLFADLLYGRLDPRVRVAGEG
ncbi:MAG TPA: ABC transporter permease [Spirillospora sp.]|nr:ABC transporter permease [Spirillospora sp.]